MENHKSQDRFISIKEVALLLGIGVSTAWSWRREKQGFPVPVNLSPRCTRFVLAEVEAFKAGYIAARLS
jgi:prophage regulatory protein